MHRRRLLLSRPGRRRPRLPSRPNGMSFSTASPLRSPLSRTEAPTRLLDLLERSGLDFQHLDRPVLTQINGVDSPFQQLLAEGDKIEIRYQP